jgi:hypothetical protein
LSSQSAILFFLPLQEVFLYLFAQNSIILHSNYQYRFKRMARVKINQLSLIKLHFQTNRSNLISNFHLSNKMNEKSHFHHKICTRKSLLMPKILQSLTLMFIFLFYFIFLFLDVDFLTWSHSHENTSESNNININKVNAISAESMCYSSTSNNL